MIAGNLLEVRDLRKAFGGVVANGASFLTGATEDTGFKGIAGHYDRRSLLFFGVDIPGQIRFTRVETGAAAIVSARLDRVPSTSRSFDSSCRSTKAGQRPSSLVRAAGSSTSSTAG